jgi:DNA repair exonuclease SbcCD ATPase subunit
MRIFGGHCDGEAFRFNHALNCIVGQNYAGKSAVFDFIRIALGLEDDVPQDLRDRLLLRLYAILGSGGKIELYLRHERAYYVVGRAFNPQVAGEGTNLKVLDLPDALACYRYDVDQDALVPVDQFTFPIEVYEQGRIHRLRDDVGRQLEMLDEFAHVGELKKEREGILTKLSENAQTLAPLSAERDQLNADVANLAAYKLELAEKEKLLPGEVEQHWAKTESVVNEVKEIISTLQTNIGQLRNSVIAKAEAFPTDFDTIFAHSVPECRTEEVVEVELVAKLVGHVRVALSEIERGRSTVVQAVQNLEADTKSLLDAWQEQRKSHVEAVRTQLRQAGVESPQEVINRVAELRRNVKSIETVKQPRLVKVNELIDLHGKARECLIGRLEDLGREITKKRQDKAKELTSALGGQIKISVTPHADTSEYLRVLNELCEEISTAQSRIQKRDEQLKRVATTVSPLQLARALARKGVVRLEDGSETTLRDLCGVTENTQTVLCRIADNIVHLNTLESVTVPDVPEILVQRRGETAYADLRTGLSQGEQSAAILTLALQTRAMPLILDQPEDELGYNYVVHLVVPKILQAKFSRQLLVVTHNANIPVLGDADYVIKMENRPRPEGGRTCVVATEGCFESNAVTRALIELEGGERAFQFRQHRYEIPITK